MKKLFLLFGVVVILVVLLGADIRRKKEAALIPVADNKPCFGYTIVEFGKGINCNGDTVRLTKVKGGGQELVRTEQLANNE